MPQYLKSKIFQDIREILAKRFFEKEEAITIAKNAGLDMTKIGFNNRSIITWDEVLSRAEIEKKLVTLIKTASIQNNGFAELEKFIPQIETGIILDKGFLVVRSNNDDAPMLLMIFDEQDRKGCERLINQLNYFVINEEASISVLTSGNGTVKEELEMVSAADIIMPIISPDFFLPKNNYLSYVRAAIDQTKKIVPVLFVTCLHARIKVLKDYLTLPPMKKFVDDYENKELAYKEVADGISGLLTALKT